MFTNDFDGTLVHPVGKGIAVTATGADTVSVRVEAGEEWDDVVAWSVSQGLWGIENLSLIPGYAGAAPVQNIGAYGVEFKDVAVSVEMFCVDTGNMLTLAAAHCGFGYRDSVFKRDLKGKVVITAVNIELWRQPRPKLEYGALGCAVEARGGMSLENIRNAVIAIRQSKLPDPKELGNAGSFFKNPVVTPEIAGTLREQYPSMPVYPDPSGSGVKLAAGWLIEMAGWKGRVLGRAAVHGAQALVLINLGGATGGEIAVLADAVAGAVYDRFGIVIQKEVNFL